MNYKNLFFILCFLLVFAAVFPAEKWNVLVSSWNDLSEKRDRSVGLLIQRSISTRLDREQNFRVIPSSSSNGPVLSFSNAQTQGRGEQADVIVYGSYYIENDRIYVIAEVYDILENRIRMERVYTGLVTVDIFDTVDTMALDIVSKIKEVLPEMTAESEIKVKKIRETLYETSKVNVKREMFTRFGFLTSTGNKTLYDYNSPGQNPTNNASGSWPFSTISFGFGFRYWDIRLDVDLSGLPGLPYYDWAGKKPGMSEPPPSTQNITLVYYLPWWGGALAVGPGLYFEGVIISTNNSGNNGSPQLYKTQNYNGPPFSLVVFWSPLHDLELMFEYTFAFGTPGNNYNNSSGSSALVYDFPPVAVGAVYYFGEFGLSAKLTYSSGRYYEWNIGDGFQNIDANMNNLQKQSAFQNLNIEIEFVYRIDFLKQ